MGRWVRWVLPLGVLALLAQVPARSGAQTAAADLRRAGEIFEASCATCHVVPDPGIETDAAWIGQLRETA